MNFVVYPDTWIRDIPLLKIEDGVYLSNRATIGTNICLSDDHILVQGIQFDRKALIGHAAVIGPGCFYGAECELGVNITTGIRVKVAGGAKIGPVAGLNHGCKIGTGAKIGATSYVGLKSSVGEGVVTPPGALIPDGTAILKQEQMDMIFSTESRLLNQQLVSHAEALKAELDAS